MKVVYLGHSGFLAETDKAYYLFDYIRGELPAMEEGKPLYVFASHSHADHYSKDIFKPQIAEKGARYVLSYDIRKKLRRSSPAWLEKYSDRIYWANPGQDISFPECRIISLKSTDLGVAYVVEESDRSIYHAGDLNWWHWEGEPDSWNRNMEVNYKREIDRLKDRQIDVAFVPLDPRLNREYWYGMDYFLSTVPMKKAFPMHFWEDYNVITKYIKEHGNREQVMVIEYEGQRFHI